MMNFDFNTRRMLARVLLVALVVLPCSLPATVLPAGAQSPLEQQRRQPAVRPALQGRVVSVDRGMIYTSISTDWPSAGITDGTVLQVQLAGKSFNARFLSPDHFTQVLNDPAARRSLDVDVACIPNRDGSLSVVGLSGDLPEWLDLKPGSPVTVVKQ